MSIVYSIQDSKIAVYFTFGETLLSFYILKGDFSPCIMPFLAPSEVYSFTKCNTRFFMTMFCKKMSLKNLKTLKKC